MIDSHTATLPRRRTARTAGALYLALALTGVGGFLIVRPRLFDADSPATTLEQLIAHDALARAGIALELGIVVTQALLALWFFRLFRSVDLGAAAAVMAFGLVNAGMILASAAMLATARSVAVDPDVAPGGDAEATVQLAYIVSDHLWSVAGVFFGLWLIPMGWLVLRSGWMPQALGWFLVAGGIGYVASAIAAALVPDLGAAKDLFTIPANIGEFWMVGYLLIFGARTAQTRSTSRDSAASEPGR